MEFAKIFKKIHSNSCEFSLIPYNSSEISYSNFIKSQKKIGFRQVLFNTELMLYLVKATSENANIILSKVNMSEDAEEDIQEELDYLLLKSRKEPDTIYKIVSELEWIADKESIDILEIKFVDVTDNFDITIKANGICVGRGINKIFDGFIVNLLLRYFYEA